MLQWHEYPQKERMACIILLLEVAVDYLPFVVILVKFDQFDKMKPFFSNIVTMK
jgi:hypothetical protein